MKIIHWLFGFFDRYCEHKEGYERNGKGLGPIGKFFLLTITAAAPILTLWGALEIGWDNSLWILKIILFIISFFLLVKAPQELITLSIVAIKHGIWILVTRKKSKSLSIENIENPENPENLNTLYDADGNKKKNSNNWKNFNANPVWDFIIGILGLVLSVAVVIVFFTFLFGSGKL